ncbi:hypothetical protein MRX96_010111 [Rhipicephalus microplus]
MERTCEPVPPGFFQERCSEEEDASEDGAERTRFPERAMSHSQGREAPVGALNLQRYRCSPTSFLPVANIAPPASQHVRLLHRCILPLFAYRRFLVLPEPPYSTSSPRRRPLLYAGVTSPIIVE